MTETNKETFVDKYMELAYAGNLEEAVALTKEVFGTEEVPLDVAKEITDKHEARQDELVAQAEAVAKEAGLEVIPEDDKEEPNAEEPVQAEEKDPVA